MKIALLTIWHCGNYGAEMQAYATYKALISLGHQVKMLDFPLDANNNLSFKIRLANCIGNFTPANHKFNAFWSKYIPSISRTYQSVDELRKDPPQADMYLVGSDQVWNPDITRDKAAAFFLDFGPENVRRASFSSSFGVSVWDGASPLTAIAKKRLLSFSGISCREQSGLDILKKEFNIDQAELTLDPTLLHSDYSELTGPLVEKPTLAFYPLSSKDYALETFCREIAKSHNMDLINANPYSYLLGTGIVWNRNSLAQWLKTIAEAQFVITPSFHGLVFSLIHHRQFAILYLAKHGRQSRITGLLEQLGLSDRYFNNMDTLRHSNVFQRPIDYELIDKKLEVLRNNSWNYLRTITK